MYPFILTFLVLAALQTSHKRGDTEGLQILISDPFHRPPAVKTSKGGGGVNLTLDLQFFCYFFQSSL